MTIISIKMHSTLNELKYLEDFGLTVMVSVTVDASISVSSQSLSYAQIPYAFINLSAHLSPIAVDSHPILH